MNEPYNVLIIEDHPIIIDVIKKALLEIATTNNNFKFNISTANNCDSAVLEIEEAKKGLPLDLVILDISLPPSSKHKLLSGEDLGVKIKQTFSNVKIIVMTFHSNNYILSNIFKTINPEGFLIKSDIDNKNLREAIMEVLYSSLYYSKTVKKLIRSHMSNQIILDQTDREILYHLSIGAKTKDLPNSVNLSLAGVERRKRHLREIFDTPKKDDKILIERARERGFI
jgi:DNA-binding NarL/FixJ family response regulator